MTYNDLPGVRFTETVSTEDKGYEQTKYPLFIIQTSTAIAALDNKVTQFSSFKTFKQIVNGKNLDKTVIAMNKILSEAENNQFYVYSVKIDLEDGFRNFLNDITHLDDIQDVIYFEEATASQTNPINTKIKAILSALENNATKGTFRRAIIIPYATVHNAVLNKEENVRTEDAVMSSLTTAISGVASGRIIVVLPDIGYCNQASGKIVATPFNEDPGYTAVNVDADQLEYNFTYEEMITLQNLGIVFVKEEKVQGVKQFRINLGVTTSFREDKADGLIKQRATADELLRRCKYEADYYVKIPEADNLKTFLQNDVNDVIKEMVDDFYISNKTKLTVNTNEEHFLELSGDIYPYGSIYAVKVNTTIQ